jgi:hypothetical protein
MKQLSKFRSEGEVMEAAVPPTDEHIYAASQLVAQLEHGDETHREWLRERAIPLLAAGLAEAEEDGRRRSAGGNSPPSELLPERLIDPTAIAPLLDANYGPLKARSAELTEAAEAWKADMGCVTVTDQQAAAELADLLQQIADFAQKKDDAEVEETRKKVKKPVFEAGKEIDGWFAALVERLQEIAGLPPYSAGAGTMQNALNVWVRAESSRKQAAAQLEAKRLADEAARQADPEQFDDALSTAMVAEDVAAQAAQHAAAPAKYLVRTTTARGTTLGMRANWRYTVTDLMTLVKAIAEGKAPIDFVTDNDSVINAAIKGEKGRRECPGLQIRNEATASRRGA